MPKFSHLILVFVAVSLVATHLSAADPPPPANPSTVLSAASAVVPAIAPLPLPAPPPQGEAQQQSQSTDLRNRLQLAEDRLTEVRRDQLNYQIERNLLKDAYSSNLETINQIITLGLALLAAVGFVGVRGLSSIRDDFKKELEQLKELKGRLESRLNEIEASQADAGKKFEQLSRENVEQDQRLKILELQEKVVALMQADAHLRALEYIAVGLSWIPDEIKLLGLRANCFLKLKRFEEATTTLERVVKLDNQDTGSALNLCELYLLIGNRKGHVELATHHGAAIRERPHLAWFFDAVRRYQDGDEAGLRQKVRELVATLPNEKQQHTRWRFDEFRYSIRERIDSPAKRLLLATLTVLEGQAAPEDVKALLDPETPSPGSPPSEV